MSNAAQRYLELKEKAGAQAAASPLTPDRDIKLSLPVEDSHGSNSLECAGPVEDSHGSNSLERAGQTVVDVVKAALAHDHSPEGSLAKEYAITLWNLGGAAR